MQAKRTESGEKITTVEDPSARYAGSKLKWAKGDYSIRFAYEATDKLTRFADYQDLKFRRNYPMAKSGFSSQTLKLPE